MESATGGCLIRLIRLIGPIGPIQPVQHFRYTFSSNSPRFSGYLPYSRTSFTI